MPGTGIKGYSGPSLYGGGYNISNGIIQSGSGASSGSGFSGNALSKIVGKVINSVGNGISNASNYVSAASRGIASNVAGIAGTDASDYGDYLREALDIAANNTAQSQAFAREQMDFQRQSDATAMAWSANEAQKNRDWQERLSNTAHQREVQDLISAGLNPILSANQGAYTGSGATGQGFASSGAMGQVDTSGAGILGQLVSTYINTASQAAVAGLYTDATRYQADMQYAINKANIDANMLMQDKSISSNEKMNRLNSDTAIANANTSAAAQLGAAGTTAGAMIESSLNSMVASIIGSEYHYAGTTYSADKGYEGTKYSSDTQRKNTKDTINAQNQRSPYYTAKQGIKNYGERLDNTIDKIMQKFGISDSYASGRHW